MGCDHVAVNCFTSSTQSGGNYSYADHTFFVYNSFLVVCYFVPDATNEDLPVAEFGIYE